MNKEDIQERIHCMENDLEILKNQLSKIDESKSELQPFDWRGVERYEIDSYGETSLSEDRSDLLFSFKDREDAERFGEELNLMSLILRLKQSIGDVHQFYSGATQYCVVIAEGKFRITDAINIHDIGKIYFSSKVNAQKVCEYLNKNWKIG